ncbi:hypothetical protein AB3X89_40750, partial [Paraburkholderia sp. BR14320]
AEQPEARHRDIQPAQRPEFLHMAGDLPHAPVEQAVERENQFEGLCSAGSLRDDRGSGRKSPVIYPTGELSCLTRQD